MLKKYLEKLNLNSKEAKTYLAILELGETNVQRISDKSDIKRTTTYDVIEDLMKKGLVGKTKLSNKTLYFAETPYKLIEQQEDNLNIAKKALPELMAIANIIDRKPKIKFYEGIEGIKNVYKDTLKHPKSEILMWGAPEMFDYFDKDFTWEYYTPQRIKNKIWLRGIGPNKNIIKKIQGWDKKQLRKTRLYDKEKYTTEVEINLYGNRFVGIMSFKEKFGLIIESQKIFNTLKSIFEMNWDLLK